jgi:hypothetical protein
MSSLRVALNDDIVFARFAPLRAAPFARFSAHATHANAENTAVKMAQLAQANINYCPGMSANDHCQLLSYPIVQK